MPKRLIIAIDGPAGAGKSTAARLLAGRLGYLYIDTGAMYRAVTLAALQEGIDLEDSRSLGDLAARVDIRLRPGDGDSPPGCLLNEVDVTEEIRSPRVSRLVSIASRVPEVRQSLVERQREMARGGGVVMDGRDIGSYVLPSADHKFFLTASLEERAWRRLVEMRQRGQDIDFETIKKELAERDELDSTREVAPLRPSPEAIMIDTSTLSVTEVVKEMEGHLTGVVG